MEDVMKRNALFVLFLLAFCGVWVFGGGRSQSSGSDSSGAPVKLTVAIAENLRVENFKTNYQTRLIEQGSNTDLEFIEFASTDYVTRLNLMVMAGGSELPDIIVAAPGDAMVYQWAREGAILPLKKYYDDPSLSPNIRDALARSGYDFKVEITSPDGDIYGIPGVNQLVGNELQDKIWHYQPWVDKLGIKIPTNTDEFRAYLQAVVSTDLNGNGRADELGLAGHFRNSIQNAWFRYLMNPFVYVGNQSYNIDNGVISVPYNTEAWRAGLKYIRSLFADGLLALEILTQDDNQVRTLCNSDPVRVASFFMTSASLINSDDVAVQYLVAPPLKGTNGTQYSTIIPSVANIRFMISANCKNPEAAFRVGDVMMREDVSITNRFGERGVNWDYPEDNPGFVPRCIPFLEGWPGKAIIYDDGAYWSGSSVQNAGWREAAPGCISYAVQHGRLIPRELMVGRQGNNSIAMSMYTIEAFGPKEILGKLIYNEDENALMSEVQTTLNNYVHEMTSNFLAGNRDIDSSWNAYVAELNTIGLPRVLATVQRVYDRMYK